MTLENPDNKNQFGIISKNLINKEDFKASLAASCTDMTQAEAVKLLSEAVRSHVDLKEIPSKSTPEKQRGK